MYATVHRQPPININMFRWIARASAAVLMAAWLMAVLVEVMFFKFDAPPAVMSQAIALAIVFSGYAIGWRHELAGGLIAILGTVAFFMVNVLSTSAPPPDAAALFAIPGMLYVAAWFSARLCGTSPAQRP